MLDNKIAEEETAAMEREKVFDAIRAWLSLSGLSFFLGSLSLSLQFGIFFNGIVSPTYPTSKLKSHKCILDIAAPIDQLELGPFQYKNSRNIIICMINCG